MKIKILIIMGLLSTAGSNLSAQDEKLTKEEIQELNSRNISIGNNPHLKIRS